MVWLVSMEKEDLIISLLQEINKSLVRITKLCKFIAGELTKKDINKEG